MNETRALVKHFLAAIAYRTQKAVRDAPDGYADYYAGQNIRTPHELVWHMTGLIGYARTVFAGGKWQPDKLESFDAEIQRLHNTLEDLAFHIDSGAEPQGVTFEQLLQGPLADAMTHVGQLALLRRLAGAPVAPENFMMADISVRNLSSAQPAPVAPKLGWKPDQPPPSPGRPLV